MIVCFGLLIVILIVLVVWFGLLTFVDAFGCLLRLVVFDCLGVLCLTGFVVVCFELLQIVVYCLF